MKSNSVVFKNFYNAISIITIVSLGVIAFIGAISPFTAATVGNSAVTSIFFAILLLASLFLGYFITKYEIFKFKNIAAILLSVVAVLVLISTISTWVEYGLFHVVRYKNTPIYYYNGNPYDVTKEACLLSFTGLKTVSVEYCGFYSLICASVLPAAVFYKCKNKTDKLIRGLFFGIALVGVISLLTLPNIPALIIFIIVSLFVTMMKFFEKNKTAKTVVRVVLLSLLLLAFVFYLLTLLNVAIGRKFPGILNKVFCENPIMRNVSNVLEGMLLKQNGKSVNILGLNTNYEPLSKINNIALTKSGIIEIEIIKEIGLIGLPFLFVFLTGSFLLVGAQIKCGKNDNFEKLLGLGVALSFFIYASLHYDCVPYIYKVNDQYIYMHTLKFVPLYICLFFVGCSFYSPKYISKEQKK